MEYFMGWEKKEPKKSFQSSLFVDLNETEQQVVDLLQKEGELFIDQISGLLQLPVSRVSAMMLTLEFKNVITALPGKMYRLR